MAANLSRFLLSQVIRRTVPQPRLSCLTVNPLHRYISTTEKKKDSATGLSIHPDSVHTKVGGPVDTNYVQRKDWISRGMDVDDEDVDTWYWHGSMFMMITGFTTLLVFYFSYIPNVSNPNKDWAQREAFLELYRREKYGFPLIDPDFIARENITLPSEEELGDFPITI